MPSIFVMTEERITYIYNDLLLSVFSSLPPLCLSLSVFPSLPPCLDVDMPTLNPVKAWTDYHYIITVLETAEPCQGKNSLCNNSAWDKMNATSIVYSFCVLQFLIRMNRWRNDCARDKMNAASIVYCFLVFGCCCFLPSSQLKKKKKEL